MPSKKEVKELNKDLVLAIEWAAAEYKYVKELQKELAKVKGRNKSLKRLRKAAKIVRYLSMAERRTDLFEEKARKNIEDFSEELSRQMNGNFILGDIITSMRTIAKELEIEHAHLAKYVSFMAGSFLCSGIKNRIRMFK